MTDFNLLLQAGRPSCSRSGWLRRSVHGCLEGRGPRQPTKESHSAIPRADGATLLLQLTAQLETASLEREENIKYVNWSLRAPTAAAQHNLNNTICSAEGRYPLQHQRPFVPARQGRTLPPHAAPRVPRCPSQPGIHRASAGHPPDTHGPSRARTHRTHALGHDSDRGICGLRRLRAPRNLTHSTQPMKQ